MSDRDKDFTKAMEDLQKAIELDPNNKAAIHNMAVALALKSGQRVGGFGDDYRDEAKKYRKRERWFNGFFVGSLTFLAVIFTYFIFRIYKFFSNQSFCDFAYDPCLELLNKTPYAVFPWIGLLALLFLPVVVLIFYFREGKRRNELLKHSYKRKTYLEERWAVLPEERQLDVEVQLMEHWMEKSSEETLLAFMNKKDSNSPPLTPAALAVAIAAAIRRGDK